MILQHEACLSGPYEANYLWINKLIWKWPYSQTVLVHFSLQPSLRSAGQEPLRIGPRAVGVAAHRPSAAVLDDVWAGQHNRPRNHPLTPPSRPFRSVSPLRPDGTALLALPGFQRHEHGIVVGDESPAQAIRGVLEDPARRQVLAAVAEGAVVGVAVLSFIWAPEHGGHSARLDQLYVAPRMRGRGTGRALP